jgi:hypothetical protein
MRKITVLSLLLAAAASYAAADINDVLSYVAMPLAVSSVCDVRGVQTDRVGQLVTYMDQANVAPADFVDVFRYVPVALVMRTDNRPDFVQWVGSQVDSGVVGTALVSSMETRLRTYDDYVPVARSRPRQSYRAQDYAYAYEPDYVPVVIRRHCERLIMEPLSLVEMPVAVANVYDLGIPQPLVSSFVVELNRGNVAPLQFVELMRYAPAALVADVGSYGQPAFVDYVRSERIGGADLCKFPIHERLRRSTANAELGRSDVVRVGSTRRSHARCHEVCAGERRVCSGGACDCRRASGPASSRVAQWRRRRDESRPGAS